MTALDVILFTVCGYVTTAISQSLSKSELYDVNSLSEEDVLRFDLSSMRNQTSSSSGPFLHGI